MKKQMLAGFVAATLMTTASAGVAEKKAQREADEAVTKATETMKTTCGNANLKTSIAWDQIDTVANKNADKMKAKNHDLKQSYIAVGKRTVSTLEALTKICKDDADYKAEIAKVAEVKVTVKEDFSDYKSAFALEGTSINVQTGHYMARSASDFMIRLKKIF